MAFKISITIRNTFLHVFNFGIFTVNARRRRPQWRRPLNAFKCGRQRCWAMKMGTEETRTDIWSEQIDYRLMCGKKCGVSGKWNKRLRQHMLKIPKTKNFRHFWAQTHHLRGNYNLIKKCFAPFTTRMSSLGVFVCLRVCVSLFLSLSRRRCWWPCA